MDGSFGFRSAWLIVGKLLGKNRNFIRALISRGHEIGCHGRDHTPFLAYSEETEIIAKLSEIKSELTEFQCIGYRSPSYHHAPALFAALSNFFKYDMSMHDVFEDVNRATLNRSGCGTVFPFFLGNSVLIEIPTTVPEDAILELEGCGPDECATRQIEQIRWIADRGGVLNLLTHPEPQFSSRPQWTSAYRQVLQFIPGMSPHGCACHPSCATGGQLVGPEYSLQGTVSFREHADPPQRITSAESPQVSPSRKPQDLNSF